LSDKPIERGAASGEQSSHAVSSPCA
jgi:hypothetical protein